MAGNSVIFVHPDGTSPSHYAAGRLASVGPDGRINWDMMTNAGVYLGHIEDRLTSTSNAGAVVHAYGVKPFAGTYGLDEEGNPVESLSALQGFAQPGMTIMEEAIAAGKPTAIINSGIIAEPGTGVFLADVENRSETEEITAEILESGVNVIMGGGEVDYLPEGTVGFFGEEGRREDGRNLIEEAQEMGYTVVYTREDLQNLPADTEKVLGIFAATDTYNDTNEAALIEDGFVTEDGELLLYGQPPINPNPPTVAEMLEATLSLNNFREDEDGFFIVLEEEGSDNFPNNNNAAGTIEAVLRADEALGVAQDFITNVRPNTLLITAADSDAGGLEIDDASGETVGTNFAQPTTDSATEAPLDGQTGNDTAPSVAAPDANGTEFTFGVDYVGTPDVNGSIVSKTFGLNAELLPSTLDNTDIYRLMYQTLFDVELEPFVDAPAPDPAPPATQDTGNVIFIHPDGTSPSHYAAGRFVQEGPDGRLNWDLMSNAGIYLEHIEDRLVSTSNTGAVVHSLGTKTFSGSYGLDENGTPVISRSGQRGVTIMEEAIMAGKATAVINSGFIAEPGSGVFLSEAENRRNVAEITADIVESGVDIILGGGEIHYLPEGEVGRFGEAGIREDGRNLIEEAEEMGYTVVYTLDELQSLPEGTTQVLGIFAAEDTYNDTTEAILQEQGFVDEDGNLILYGQPPENPTPPTVAQMLEAALPILSQDPDGFMVVMEEEGTDNFGNNNNAAGTIEAVLRADAAIGVAKDFIENTDPNTLLVTTADSNAGGLEVDDASGETVGTVPVQPPSGIEVPLDGQTGNDTEPFISAPATNPAGEGQQYTFGVGWAGTPDFAGSIVAKAHGLNADLLPSTLDNTFIYEIMYRTLFGDVLPNLIDGTPEAEVLVGEDGNDLIRADIGNDVAAGGLGDDIIYGEEGDDVLRGDLNSSSSQVGMGGDDTLYGGLGNDRIGGKGGNDQLWGDEGDDAIWGDDGDDVLYGGLGNDTLTGDDFSGGSGSDIFVLAAGDGTDTIVDFEVGIDFIGLLGGLEFGQLSITQEDSNTLIGYEGETLASLSGVTDTLTSADFVTVTL